MIKRKKPLKRSSPPRRSTTPTRKTRVKPVNRKRKASEFKRAYGSKERVAWVKARPCEACNVIGYSENAHLLGNGGAGRKGHHTTIGALCGPRPAAHDFVWPGCHSLYDEHRSSFDQIFPDFDPELVAGETCLAWDAHCARVSQERTPND